MCGGYQSNKVTLLSTTAWFCVSICGYASLLLLKHFLDPDSHVTFVHLTWRKARVGGGCFYKHSKQNPVTLDRLLPRVCIVKDSFHVIGETFNKAHDQLDTDTSSV